MARVKRSATPSAARVLRRHPFVVVGVFVGVAALLTVLASVRQRTAAASQQQQTAETQLRQRDDDAVARVERVLLRDIAQANQQIADREQQLAALDAETATPDDAAVIAARLNAARQRAAANADALARDRQQLAAYQAEANAPAPVDPEVAAANQALKTAQDQLAALENRLTPQHPDVLRARTEVRERQMAVVSATNRAHAAQADDDRSAAVKALLTRISAEEQERRRLAAQIAALQNGSSNTTSSAEERTRLTNERAQLVAVRDALEGTRTDLRREVAAGVTTQATSDKAAPSPRVASLSPSVMALGLVSSLAIALLVGFVVDARDRRIHDAGDIEAATATPLLASISEIVPAQTAPRALDREVSTLPEPENPMLVWHARCPRRTVEQYRRLVQALRRMRVDRQVRVIGVTSALPGEGKTLSTVNLAVTLAESYRQRVLIVDADLRRPAVSALLGIAPQEGLSDWLRQDDERECPMLRLTSRISVVPAGTPDQDPTALLTSLRMGLLVASARTDFDWVVIDTPPTGLIADAGTLEGSVDGFLVLTAAGRTDVTVLQQTLATLGDDRVLGVVLNRLRRSSGADSDAYSDYYAASGASQ